MERTIYREFYESVKKYPARTAFLYKTKGKYLGMTYQELSDSVDAVAGGLKKLGIGKGDKVAIMSYNRPEWAIADLAVLKLGGVVVPLYYMPGHLLPPANVKYLLNDSGAKLVFVENAEIFNLVVQIRSETPNLKKVILFEDLPAGEKGLLRFSDLKQSPNPLAGEDQAVRGDDVATIVYTSGTTGEPKGVMLTHHNIVSNAFSAIKRCSFTPDDVVISYLPLGHMFERTCGYYAVLFEGGMIGYAQDLSTVVSDAEIIRPTILLAVPRVLEKAYNVAVQKIEGSSPLKRKIAAAAVKNLNRRTNLRYKKLKVPLGLKLKCSFYDALVASKFRKLGGGRIRLIVSGGAPLNYQMGKIIHILGFEIIEGWGLTETSPVSTCGVPGDNRIGSVGKPFDGVEVRIGENDEVLVRGPNVMKGYFNRPDETAKIIDREGWLHSGDQGKFDPYGNLVITGRIKELIVTSSGKKIPPAPIEAKMTFSAIIDQVVMCGDNRPFLVGLVIPCRDAIERFATEHGIGAESYPQLLERDPVKELIKNDIAQAIADLPSYEKPKAVGLLAENFTVENELLTATLKIKRDKVLARFAQLIAALYGDATGGETGKNIIAL
jgi:long-chain acyl-CoA synthetase